MPVLMCSEDDADGVRKILEELEGSGYRVYTYRYLVRGHWEVWTERGKTEGLAEELAARGVLKRMTREEA